MSKPKIALMSYTMDNREGKGTALYARKLIEQLIKDDRFEWYLVHFESVDDEIYTHAHEIIMPTMKLPFATRFVRTLLFFWYYRNEGFSIIHWFQPRLYPFFWFAPAKNIVVTAHGAGDITVPSHFIFSRAVFNFLMCYFHHYIDAIIAVSSFGKEEIVQYYRIPAYKVYAVYNGGGENFVALEKKHAKEEFGSTYGIWNPFILDVSRLEPHKNVPTLIKAYTKSRMEIGYTHDLVIVGSRERDAERVYAAARASMFANDIHFIEHVPSKELNMVYSAADLFVFPSLNEGFGLPVLEAMASGTPVITSNVTALPEIVGDAGLAVAPTISSVAEGIQDLLQDQELRRVFTERGLMRARMFSWRETARGTSAIYAKLLGL